MTTSLADRLARCAPRAATLILIEETLLTRTRVTAATAAALAPPVTLRQGDRRLADLTSALDELAPAPSTIAEFDPRTLISLTCADGSTLAIEGSATEDDGTMYLRIGDTLAVTRAPLRRRLDALARPPTTEG